MSLADSVRPASHWLDALVRHLEEINERAPFVAAVTTASTQRERFEAIHAYYTTLWPIVKRTPPNRWAHDVYELPWQSYFSPIEKLVWDDIRMEGVVLYPQHPVAGYFVDFGHPVARVALECDGAAYHQDKARDARRQAAIEAKGWTVYRLTGADCMRSGGERHSDETDQWIYEAGPAQRLVREIGIAHGLR